jgi:ABC-2 type transport system ATP-binding protein
MEYILQVKDLHKEYKNFKALNGINMNVPKGAIYGFVGRNGAGKTTLIRTVCGLQLPTSGSFTLNGIQSTDKRIYKARECMGAVIETPALFLDMTARDNLIQQSIIMGIPSYDKINELLALVGLSDTGKKLARNFSLGMRQRLGIALALVGDPDFLILDEPINGLDPQGIIEIRELILKLNRERGITVLISSHLLDELSRLATHYGFIDKGKIITEMTAEELSSKCRKCIRLELSDTAVFARVMDSMGYEYNILDDRSAHLYTDIKFSDLAIALAAEGCDVISAVKEDESLEGFFMSLVGGNTDV